MLGATILQGSLAVGVSLLRATATCPSCVGTQVAVVRQSARPSLSKTLDVTVSPLVCLPPTGLHTCYRHSTGQAKDKNRKPPRAMSGPTNAKADVRDLADSTDLTGKRVFVRVRPARLPSYR